MSVIIRRWHFQIKILRSTTGATYSTNNFPPCRLLCIVSDECQAHWWRHDPTVRWIHYSFTYGRRWDVWGSGVTTPRFPDIGTRWWRVVSFIFRPHCHRYLLDRWPEVPQNQPGHCTEERYFAREDSTRYSKEQLYLIFYECALDFIAGSCAVQCVTRLVRIAQQV